MHDAPLTIDESVHFRRVPYPEQLLAARLIGNKGIEVVAQHHRVAAVAGNHMWVEILVPHDMRILVELQKMRNFGRTTDKKRLDRRIEIADVFMVVMLDIHYYRRCSISH